MLKKLIRTVFGEAGPPVVQVRSHSSGQLAMLSTQELERRRFYERMVQHQRLSEIEDEQRRRF